MSVLWCGGEDIDFPNGSNWSTMTQNAASFRSGYARCAMRTTATVGQAKSTVFPGGAVTSVWATFRFIFSIGGTTPSNAALFGFGQSGTSSGVFFGYNSGATGNINISTYNGTTATTLATATGVTTTAGGILYRIDMQVINYGASGTVNIYVNGSLALSFTGNITVSGVTGFDSIFANLGGTGANPVDVSEVIVADEDLRGWPGLVTMAPSGNGTTQNWSNPGFANFNPININDANSTFVNTTAQDEQAALIDLPAGTFNIKAVRIAVRALHTAGSTATGVKLGVNNAGTVAVGSTHTVTTAFATYDDIFANDPTTSNPWLQADMNGLQLDLRSA